MELTKTGTVVLDKGNTQKVNCFLFHSDILNRDLMVHEDVDNKAHSSVSDSVTGFRMFGVPQKINVLKMETVNEHLDNFIKHFTVEGIQTEFQRIETVVRENTNRKKK